MEKTKNTSLCLISTRTDVATNKVFGFCVSVKMLEKSPKLTADYNTTPLVL